MNYEEILSTLNPLILSLWLGSLIFSQYTKIMNIIILIVLVLNIIIYFNKKSYKYNLLSYLKTNKELYISIGIFLFSCSIGIILGNNTDKDIDFWGNFIKSAFYIFIPIIIIKKISEMKRVLLYISIIDIIYALYGIYGYMLLNYNRAGDPIPNLYAWTLLTIMPIGVVYCLLYNRYRYFYLIPFITNFIALILTKSRACWISFMIAIFVCLFLERKNLSLKKFKLPLIVSLLSVMLSFPALTERINLTVNYNNNYTIERVYIWESAIKVANDNIITGIGMELGKFGKLYDGEYINEKSKERNVSHPHNLYLYFLVTSGLCGLIGFVYFLIKQIKYFYKNILEDDIFIRYLSYIGICFFIVTIVSQCFDSLFHFIRMQRVYWALLGFIIACIETVKFKNIDKNL